MPEERVAAVSSNRKVFVGLVGEEVLREFGRIPFPVLQAFSRCGYEVLVHDGFKARLCEAHRCDAPDLPQPARLTLSVQGVTYSSEIPDKCEDYWYVFDRPMPAAGRRSWGRRIRLRFDLFSPFWLRAPIIAPYPMFPAHAERATAERLTEMRRSARAMRVFFAGDAKGYVRPWVRYPSPKLPRQEVLNILRDETSESLVDVTGVDEIDGLCGAGFVCKFVLSESGSGIPQAQWLSTMARADFFLCPPGIVMPMCHNVIEAMAVGTIPLIGYPEWFHPKLEHLRNCIAYDGRDDLVAKMRMVLAMPQAQIDRLRAAVIEYYEMHLRPETLVRAIEARPERDLDVLIYTELNMARHAARLGPRSVLMRGPDAGGPLRSVGRWLDRHRG